jgi:hypothetical protein
MPHSEFVALKKETVNGTILKFLFTVTYSKFTKNNTAFS